MKLAVIITLFATTLCGQVAPVGTQPVVTVTPAPTQSTGFALPSKFVGCGPSWNRGAAYPVSLNCQVAVRLTGTNWYSWTSIDTPVATTSTSAPTSATTSPSNPIPSSITTGGAYVWAQSSRVSLVAIMQFGFTAAQATSTVAPTITGTMALPFKPWASKNIFIMPYLKALSAPTPTNSSGVASVILQPGITIGYGFN